MREKKVLRLDSVEGLPPTKPNTKSKTITVYDVHLKKGESIFIGQLPSTGIYRIIYDAN